MNFRLNNGPSSKISTWLEIKKTCYSELIEIEKEKITYNTALLSLPYLAWEIDPVQNR